MQGSPVDKFSVLFIIQLICLLFWGSWFGLAFITNVFDFMDARHVLPAPWAFRSHNYALLAQVVSIYHLGPLYIATMFVLNMALQGLSSVLFFCAFLCSWRSQTRYWPLVYPAFLFSISLWAIFVLMEEVFIAYQYESTHVRLFMFELITLLLLHVRPERPSH